MFINFDVNNAGIPLSQMTQLGTETGNFAALAQHAEWVKNSFDPNTGYNMYLTETQPAGVTGDSAATGCSDLLDAGLAMAIGYAAFYHPDPHV